MPVIERRTKKSNTRERKARCAPVCHWNAGKHNDIEQRGAELHEESWQGLADWVGLWDNRQRRVCGRNGTIKSQWLHDDEEVDTMNESWRTSFERCYPLDGESCAKNQLSCSKAHISDSGSTHDNEEEEEEENEQKEEEALWLECPRTWRKKKNNHPTTKPTANQRSIQQLTGKKRDNLKVATID